MSKSKELSSSVLSMKFMKRRQEAELRERLRREEEDRLIQARWVITTTEAKNNVILILSDDRFDLSPPVGRRSFQGCNPALEALVTLQLREHKQTQSRHAKRKKKLAEAAEEEEKVVTDQQMTEFAVASAAKRKR
jgi:hypothetical protein